MHATGRLQVDIGDQSVKSRSFPLGRSIGKTIEKNRALQSRDNIFFISSYKKYKAKVLVVPYK